MTGCIAYDNYTRIPQENFGTCVVDDASHLPSWDSALPVRQGRAVTLWTTGIAPASQNTRVLTLAGAPGRDTDDRVGTVQVGEPSRTTGLLAPTQVPLDMPGGGGVTVYQFGAALLATDVIDCVQRSGSSFYESCGQELLVGAPDRATTLTPGVVSLYTSDTATNQGYRWQSTISAPTSMPLTASAHFGASFAAPKSPPDVTTPWMISPDPAPWVAIGAPGDQKVLVYYDLDRTRLDPLTDAGTAIPPRVVELSAPFGNFGYAMAAGDFDGDGVPDLAVGAPGPRPYDFTDSASRRGQIYMFWGTTDTTEPMYPFLDWTSAANLNDTEIDPLIVASATAPNAWYDPVMRAGAVACPTGAPNPLSCATGGGTALAAGRVRSDDDARDYLLAGYPSWSRGKGYVCQFVFQKLASGERTRAPNTQCFPDSTNASLAPNQFGFAVAWADLNPVDSFGSKRSVESRYLEAAISSPAADGPSGSGLPMAGRIDMIPSDDGGINPALTLSDQLHDNEGRMANGRFGSFISTGYVHASPFEDVWAGSPARGSGSGGATLSLADNPAQCSSASPESEWLSVDANSITQTVRTFNRPDSARFEVQFPTGYQLRMTDASGALCGSTKDASFTGIIDLPVDARFVTDSRWSCSGPTSQTWTGQNAHHIINQILQTMGVDNESLDAEIDPTLAFTAPSDADLTVSFSKLPTGKLGIHSSCNIADPITLTIGAAVCETP